MSLWAISLGHNFYCHSWRQNRVQMAMAVRYRYQGQIAEILLWAELYASKQERLKS